MTPTKGTPAASSPQALARMQRQRRRDTQPELQLRSELHALGLRYRVDRAPIPKMRRRADIVFTQARVAVWVQGCFWHGCPEHMTWPKSNGEWWREKIKGNIARDHDTDERLSDAGWLSMRVWEHEDPTAAAEKVAEAVRARSKSLKRQRQRPASSPDKRLPHP